MTEEEEEEEEEEEQQRGCYGESNILALDIKGEVRLKPPSTHNVLATSSAHAKAKLVVLKRDDVTVHGHHTLDVE